MIGAKPAQQDRSRRTTESLLEAMDELLVGGSFTDITITALAGRASVSPATIYDRFSNRDALVSILIELYARKVTAWLRSPEHALDIRGCATLREVLERLGRQNWAMAEELGYVIGPAFVQWQLRPDLRDQSWFHLQRSSRAGFAAMLGMFPDELGPVGAEEAADALSIFANMMLSARLLHWPEPGSSSLPQTADEYAGLLADFGCGFIEQRARRQAA
jgi:AcrR family transcriptional regulator